MKLIKNEKKILIIIFSFSLFFSNIYCVKEKATVEATTKVRNKNLVNLSSNHKNSNSASNKNSNQNKNSKSELNGGIFISEKSFKKKDINNSVSPTASYSSKSVNDAFKSDSKLAEKSDLGMVIGMDSNNNYSSDLNVGKGPIYLEAWVKYFKYTDADLDIETPKNFFKNNEFYNQMKLFPKADLKQIGDDGLNTYIRDNSYFYVLLFSNTINFVTSKQVQLQKTYDSININFIDTVPEGKGYENGGITDFGNFNEGFCFKIITTKPKITNWVLCMDNLAQKTSFMTYLKKLKIKMQRDQGIIEIPESGDKNKKETLSDVINPGDEVSSRSQHLKSDNKGNLGVVFNSDQKITDGYWIVLQEWTQCSLKCGGGTSTLHRMCVPPKNGGAPCQGGAILTKPCNTQPCPSVKSTNELKNNSTFTMKPIVKVMPFSSRPQRYTKCIIKESDLMMTQKSSDNFNNNPLIKDISNSLDSIKIPTRVVMNNRTITIFSGEDYQTLVTVFNLDETKFFRSSQHKNCFLLVENKIKNVELCPFGYSTDLQAVDEWDRDFHLFQKQCKTPTDLIYIDEADLEKKLQEKIKQARQELLEEREKQIKDKLQEKEEVELENVIKNTNEVALQAIKKELNLEEMIKREEAEKEAREERELRNKIENEKKKSECIIKAIKERKLENQINEKAREAEQEVKKIKTTAVQQVLIRRSQLKNFISQMRKKSKLRQNKLQHELHTVRLSVSQEIGKAYKKGDINKCKSALQDKEKRKMYCQGNMLDDYDGYNNCINGDDFCVVCCETEFGELNLGERDECFKSICQFEKNEGEQVDGRWIWHNAIK